IVIVTHYGCQLACVQRKDAAPSHDFGNDIIPTITREGLAYAHPYPLSGVQSDPQAEPYWLDVGTLEAYWKANLDLAAVPPDLYIVYQYWPLLTPLYSPPPLILVYYRPLHHRFTLTPRVPGACIISRSG
ncbi:sugar phosphate nucleotidyltransferase, partial [Salmonella enterica]|uniref:sugar phosphate nucleotidyltransferase n=1 Tax=Salmonella enterica TaxID=28901 RepID=UPI00398C3A4A